MHRHKTLLIAFGVIKYPDDILTTSALADMDFQSSPSVEEYGIEQNQKILFQRNTQFLPTIPTHSIHRPPSILPCQNLRRFNLVFTTHWTGCKTGKLQFITCRES
jgi:hypothetical protein